MARTFALIALCAFLAGLAFGCLGSGGSADSAGPSAASTPTINASVKKGTVFFPSLTNN
jgi:hypothetical protein